MKVLDHLVEGGEVQELQRVIRRHGRNNPRAIGAAAIRAGAVINALAACQRIHPLNMTYGRRHAYTLCRG